MFEALPQHLEHALRFQLLRQMIQHHLARLRSVEKTKRLISITWELGEEASRRGITLRSSSDMQWGRALTYDMTLAPTN